MQVEDVSNIQYGPQMFKSVSGGCAQDKAAGTFCIV